jgi:hypothetical protein
MLSYPISVCVDWHHPSSRCEETLAEIEERKTKGETLSSEKEVHHVAVRLVKWGI